MIKLLFDQNLSTHLVIALADLHPGSAHTRNVGLASAPDEKVFRYAGKNGFTIVSKDVDFHHWSFLFGFPPKVIWIRRGNCSTQEVEAILRSRHADIETFIADEEASILGLA